MKPSNPYKIFESWWGEPLSKESVRRAVHAPRSQQVLFLQFAAQYEPIEIPSLKPGILRPFISNDPLYTGKNYKQYWASALSIMLYSHEVVLEYSFGYPAENGVSEFRKVLPRLLELKPLADLGAIHFLYIHWSRAYHPSMSGPQWAGFDDDRAVGRFLGAIETLNSTNDYFLQEPFRSRYAGSLEDVAQSALFHFRVYAGVALNLKTRWPSHIQLLARSEAEQFVLELGAERVSLPSMDQRHIQVRKLAKLAVPEYSLTIPGLVSLRKDDAAFAEWRDGLGRAMAQVSDLAGDKEEWDRTAREIVAAELTPLRESLITKTKKSSALSAAQLSLKSIAFSGLGAGAGAWAGDDFTSALVGAAAGKASEIFTDYIEAVRERRRARAVLDMIVTFANGPK